MRDFKTVADLVRYTEAAKRRFYSPHGSAPTASYECEHCGFGTADAQVIFDHVCRCSLCGQRTGSRIECRCDRERHGYDAANGCDYL